MRAKQLPMATTARLIWLCACIRYWPYCGVGTCASSAVTWYKSMLLLSFYINQYYIFDEEDKSFKVSDSGHFYFPPENAYLASFFENEPSEICTTI